jgi:RND family efflux transporter MFP subunit
MQGPGAADGRLRNLDYPAAELEKLRRGERASRTIAVPSPAAGTVVEKMAVEGMRYQPGETLFRIVDTSIMWVLAEVYEQDLAFVKVGDMAKVVVNTWPDRSFMGKVTFIYPSIGKESRTARLRIEVANPDGLLRADMAATVEIDAPIAGRWVAAPDSAIIDTGKRQVVLVERGEGKYEPRPVKLGVRVPGYAQVLEGLKPGERVVTSANFLIDAESNLRTALAAFTAGDGK